MTRLKVQQFGDSLGVVLVKTILERFDLKDGDTLYLTQAPDRSTRVTPYDPIFEPPMRAAREGAAAYRNTSCELAR